MYIVINELEKDVLREIISIGLAGAADSFSEFAKDTVLLNVPDVKIIEPKVLPDVINEYEEVYSVIRSVINGDLHGKTFLLFTSENIEGIAYACLGPEIGHNPDEKAQKDKMQQELSQIISAALANQLSKILKLELYTDQSVILFSNQGRSIKHILEDLPEYQPFVITIKTHFKNLVKAVDLPLLVVFDSTSVSTLLRIIRRDNLYDYKLLKEKA